MICPVCKKEIEEDSKFCGMCGSKIPRCTNCGAPIYDNSSLCEKCRRLDHTGSEKIKQKKSGDLKTVLAILAAFFVVGIATMLTWSLLTKKSDTYLVNIESQASNDDANSEITGSASENEGSTENSLNDEAFSDDEEAAEDDDMEYEEDLPDDTDEEDVDEPDLTPDEEEETESNDPLEQLILTSDSSYITSADLSGLGAYECRLLRNGIYARHGRMFKDESLTKYFSRFEWYNAVIPADDFDNSVLNACEKANINTIVVYEEKMGYQ